MGNIKPSHLWTALGVIAALGFGFLKFQVQSERTYSEANDPIKFVEYNRTWAITVHNTGPATEVVGFYWSPKDKDSAWCKLETFFSEDERRELNNPCPEFYARFPEENGIGMAVLTKTQFERSNWRKYFLENPVE